MARGLKTRRGNHHPTQLIVELNSALWHMIVILLSNLYTVPEPEHDKQQVHAATFLGPNWGGQEGVNRRDIAHMKDKIQFLPLPVQEV